jgi:hypothetical protein
MIRVFSLVDAEPTLAPTVKDVNGRTVYLTGDENVFVKYKSIAEFSTGAEAHKASQIVEQYVLNGSQTIYNLPTGTIDGVDSNTFYFSVTDTRENTTRDALVRELIPYVKLTCSITEAELNTDGELTFTVSGNYYNGSFGAVDNSLEIEYSIIQNEGDIEWVITDVVPTFNGHTYEATHTIKNLDYKSRYTITVNAIDEVSSAQTDSKTVVAIPVYDWSAEDFRHNTDVNYANGKAIYGTKADGSLISVLDPCDSSGNVAIGYGNYIDEAGSTNIYGDSVEVHSNKNINITAPEGLVINGREYAANKILWSGASHMNGNQSITLAEAISEQANGVVLVFSLYRNSAAENVSINTAFVSKKEVELLPGAPHTFWMAVNAGFSIIGAKYLYISDTAIDGHEGNTTSGSNSGITFNNSNYVLRYVIGV